MIREIGGLAQGIEISDFEGIGLIYMSGEIEIEEKSSLSLGGEGKGEGECSEAYLT